MKIEELMTKEVHTCHPDDTLSAAAGVMWTRDCGALPVVDEMDRVVGMITDRDICMAGYLQGAPLHAIQVSVAMSRQARTCRTTDDVEKAEEIMREHQVRRLPVVDAEDRLNGVISLADVARQAAAPPAERAKDVTADGLARTIVTICEPHPIEVAAP